jgi:hypothetical protein
VKFGVRPEEFKKGKLKEESNRLRLRKVESGRGQAGGRIKMKIKEVRRVEV